MYFSLLAYFGYNTLHFKTDKCDWFSGRCGLLKKIIDIAPIRGHLHYNVCDGDLFLSTAKEGYVFIGVCLHGRREWVGHWSLVPCPFQGRG